MEYYHYNMELHKREIALEPPIISNSGTDRVVTTTEREDTVTHATAHNLQHITERSSYVYHIVLWDGFSLLPLHYHSQNGLLFCCAVILFCT